MGNVISRRSFIKATALSTAAAAAGSLAECAIAGASETSATSGSATSGLAASSATSDGWDKEADFVVVGTGTASMGAFAAAQAGNSVIAVEKNAHIGGTTLLSGCVCWVPNNYVMAGLGYGPDVSDDKVVAYLRTADVSHAGVETLQKDYVANAKDVYKWIADTFDLEQGIFPATCDYYGIEGAMGIGRSLGYVDSQVDANNVGMDEPFAEVFSPLYDSLGIEVLLETQATDLIKDGTGRVIGIEAKSEDGTLRIKADKGVLLGAGGFEYNEEMRDQYLYGPLLGLVSPSTNTGDGIKMGQRAGADLGNMSSIWGNPFYILDENDPTANILGDYGMYAGLPGAAYFNKRGKRFVNEAAGYDLVTNAMYNYSTLSYSFENLISYMVFDADHVASYLWPGFAEDEPDYVQEYDTLDALADGCGIQKDAFLAEVEHFNEMAEAGADADFGRGAWQHDTIQAESMGKRDDLANAALGPIVTAPFYAVKVGPGAFGTNGGLKVDVDARVLDTEGTPIDGLYACGNCSASIFGSIYPGPGGTVGPGFYQAVRAANHACDLGILQ